MSSRSSSVIRTMFPHSGVVADVQRGRDTMLRRYDALAGRSTSSSMRSLSRGTVVDAESACSGRASYSARVSEVMDDPIQRGISPPLYLGPTAVASGSIYPSLMPPSLLSVPARCSGLGSVSMASVFTDTEPRRTTDFTENTLVSSSTRQALQKTGEFDASQQKKDEVGAAENKVEDGVDSTQAKFSESIGGSGHQPIRTQTQAGAASNIDLRDLLGAYGEYFGEPDSPPSPPTRPNPPRRR